MVGFRAAYFIDEIHDIISKKVEQDILDEFYLNNSLFTVQKLPDEISPGKKNPLLCVLWNIYARGVPTRANINLAKHILKTHLDENKIALDFSGPEAQIKAPLKNFKNVDPELLKKFLSKFRSLSEDIIAEKYGYKFLKLFRIYNDLFISSRLHIFITLLYLNTYPKVLHVKSDINEKLFLAILEDINNTITQLNHLISDKETTLPLIEFKSPINPIYISFNQLQEADYQIATVDECENEFNTILTDRPIQYENLGEVHEMEEDGEFKQEFEFDTPVKKKALYYFLRNIFRKSDFWPGQIPILNRAIQHKDVIGLLPTGGGKSLTYQLIGLLQPGVTIVIEPINSLMKDQYDGLISDGITKAQYINAFNTRDEMDKHLKELRDGKYQFVFISPERLQIKKFRNKLEECAKKSVYFTNAVIDEAHCVSEWGHDFRHTYLNVAKNLKRFCHTKDADLMFFGLTATASFDVLADVQRELMMPEDTIVTLPAEAIDRKELNFEIIKIEKEVENNIEYYERINEIGRVKHPKLVKWLKEIPQHLDNKSKNSSLITFSNNFYEPVEREYPNAGIIFCPTKSDKLRNGVLNVYDTLKELSFLETRMFFGGGDYNTISNKRVVNQAKHSFDNQVEFMENKSNLMIATKAFGMGLDKSNIRFTVHYTLPPSVESFYQEAGRAGRDRRPALCSVLYHEDDIKTNLDFHENSFKEFRREKEIAHELLTEVQYEDEFFVGLVKRVAKDRFNEVGNVTLYNDKFISVFGPYHEKKVDQIWIGRIDLTDSNLAKDKGFIKNFKKEKSDQILDHIRYFIKKECNNSNYLDWLKTRKSPGIKSLIEQRPNKTHTLLIGFNNNAVDEIVSLLENDNEKFEALVVRAAYNFCKDEDEFIDNLKAKYKQHTDYKHNLTIPSEELEAQIQDLYHKIRNDADTFRTIYRLMILGIIDDYVIDYYAKVIRVTFKGKTDQEYLENLRTYLQRFMGVNSTKTWMNKVEKYHEVDSILVKVLFTLIKFTQQEIAEKRKRAIKYMKDLCEKGFEEGEKVFRENIVYYFTSKYARLDYLPKDTDGGKIANADIVSKYLDYIKEPPDGLGAEINNAKHLRGACENLRITMTRDNYSIDILTAYSTFALESQIQTDGKDMLTNPSILKAKQLYRDGFYKMIEDEKWDNVLELINKTNEMIIDINPQVKPSIEPLKNEFLMHRTRTKLHSFLETLN